MCDNVVAVLYQRVLGMLYNMATRAETKKIMGNQKHRAKNKIKFFVCIFILVVLFSTRPARGEHSFLTLQDLEVLQQPRFQMPSDWKWGYFVNGDGANIRYGYAIPARSRGTIVILSGIVECGETYFETIRDFLKNDYSVWFMDWRGQGGSDRYLPDRERAYSLGINHDVNDINQLISTIVSKQNNGPIVIVGHSWAGPAILLYLHDHPDAVKAAALVAPAFSINNNVPGWLITAVSNFQCCTGKSKHYAPDQGSWQEVRQDELRPEAFSHDPVRMQMSFAVYDKYPALRVGGATWAFVKEFQYACDKVADFKFLNTISIPILTISAPEDWIANPQLEYKISQQLPKGEYLSIQGARHALFFESDEFRNQTLQAINQFAERQISNNQNQTITKR